MLKAEKQDLYPDDPNHDDILIDDNVLRHKTEGTFLKPITNCGFHRQICFVSGTKLKFPSLLHLSRRGKNLKAIILGLPEDHLHRDDICLLFVTFLMFK